MKKVYSLTKKEMQFKMGLFFTYKVGWGRGVFK